jgi:hypothetical protein
LTGGHPMNSDNWKKWYYISTYLLAVIAITGFIYSINSSMRTSKYLTSLENNLNNFTQPNIKLENLNWLRGSMPPDCKYPPLGVNVEYINKSIIPIKLVNPIFDIFIGEVFITQDNSALFEQQEKTHVLTAGETIGFTVVRPIDFKRYLLNKHNIFDPPFIKFRLSAIIMTLNEDKKYGSSPN